MENSTSVVSNSPPYTGAAGDKTGPGDLFPPPGIAGRRPYPEGMPLPPAIITVPAAPSEPVEIHPDAKVYGPFPDGSYVTDALGGRVTSHPGDGPQVRIIAALAPLARPHDECPEFTGAGHHTVLT